MLLNRVASVDTSVLLIEAAYVAVALHLWQNPPTRLALQSSLATRDSLTAAGQSANAGSRASSGRPAPVARLPDMWAQLDAVDLEDELRIAVKTCKAVPRCIRGPFHRILTQTLVAVETSYAGSDEQSIVRAWTLFLLLPRMLLHTAQRGGEAGERELRKRIAMFDSGQWLQLLQRAHGQAITYGPRKQLDEKARITKAMLLIERVS